MEIAIGLAIPTNRSAGVPKVTYPRSFPFARLKQPMTYSFAYLSQGRLHVKLGDEPVRPVDSQFGQSLRDRAAQIQNRNLWKTQGTGARFMSGGLLWGNVRRDANEMRITVTGISSGCQSGELLYSLSTNEIGGVFRLRNHGREEQRLLHTGDFRVHRLAASPGQDAVACVLQQNGQSSSIAIMRGDGTDLREVTQGDTIDDSPSWVPGSDREVVFQSAAIGRNGAGFAVAQAPFTIHKLDLETGTITTLAEEAKFDLLHPLVDGKGALWYIRRPYRDPRQPVSPWQAALDLILLPFHLLYAVFQFLNFFTARYTGNTLTSAGNARQQHADIRKMMVWGNLLGAENDVKEDTGKASARVPNSWELIRQPDGGKPEVIAKGVLSFDVYEDGSVLYTNGGGIYLVDANCAQKRLAHDSMIEQVAAMQM